MDDTDPDLSIPDRGDDTTAWLASLCGGRGLEIVGPSRHRADTFTVMEVATLHDMDLRIVSRSALGEAALGRFKDLGRALAGLRHPHIVPIYDMGVHEGRPYILGPRFEGQVLRDRIGDQPLPVAEAVDLAISLAWAVHFLHEAGVFELDLSANGVFLADGRGPMIDLQRTLERRVLEEAWIHGGITGAEAPGPPYGLHGESLGPGPDIYALGAILFQMLTGRAVLSRGAAGRDAFLRSLASEPERPRSLNANVDRALESICLRCLSRRSRDRYDSAEALADQLTLWRSGGIRTGLIGRLWQRFRSRSGP